MTSTSSSVTVDMPLPYIIKNELKTKHPVLLTLSLNSAGKQAFEVLSVAKIVDNGVDDVYLLQGNYYHYPVGYGTVIPATTLTPVSGMVVRVDMRPMIEAKFTLFIPRITDGFSKSTWVGYNKYLDSTNLNALKEMLNYYNGLQQETIVIIEKSDLDDSE